MKVKESLRSRRSQIESLHSRPKHISRGMGGEQLPEGAYSRHTPVGGA
jgi:hypothetical protein